MHLERETSTVGVIPLIREIKSGLLQNPYIKFVEACGGVRRGEPMIRNVDIVAAGSYADLIACVPSPAIVVNEPKQRKFTALIEDLYLNFWAVSEENFGAYVLYLTGSVTFIKVIRGLAKKQGYRLRDWGLYHNDILIAGRTEHQIFDALGYEWIDPAQRGGRPTKDMWKEKGGKRDAKN